MASKNTQSWKEHIAINPHIHHGEACIRGTRLPVTMIVASLGDGMSEDELRREYPQVKPQHIRAALHYAAEVLKTEIFLPVS